MSNEVKDVITITKDGKQYEVSGSLTTLINRVLQETDAQEGVSTEDAAPVANVIYSVSINQVTQEHVDEFAGLVNKGGTTVLFAINPGRAQRTDAMEALERLAETNDIDVYHSFTPLQHLMQALEVTFEVSGPLGETVKQALAKANETDSGNDDEDDGDSDDGSEGVEDPAIEPATESAIGKSL